MSGGIAIIAALPREVAVLVKGWERREIARNVIVWTRGDAVVACAGMGVARAVLACEVAMKTAPVAKLISVGLAGACDPKLRIGDVVSARVVVDTRTGERFEAGSPDGAVIVTGAAIGSVREKARLREAYSASAVEMEAAAVARIAQVHGLEFRAVKAISDDADFAMDGLDRFVDAEGQFRVGAFAPYISVRPWKWGEVVVLGRNSAKAIRGLTEALRSEID